MKAGYAPGLAPALLLVTVGGCADGSAEAADSLPPARCEPAVVVGELDPVLQEASGLARDPHRQDLFWVHNDSGNEAVLYAVDASAALVGTVPVLISGDRDIEDLAIARCGELHCAYIGDIGDNDGAYPFVRIHSAALPAVPEVLAGTPARDAVSRLSPVAPRESWRLRYPDGPRDAEGLVVDDRRNEIAIISKGREGEVVLYGIGIDELRRAAGEPVTLHRIGRLSVPVGASFSQLITAADLSPDRRTLALRSYMHLYLVPWAGVFAQDTAIEPAVAPLLGALEPQGEGIAWGADGETLWLVSEGRGGRPPQLSRIRCPVP